MKPLFTLHAGEWVAGNEVEKQLGQRALVWVPAKDTGIDFLVTRRNLSRGVGLQVKFSRAYSSGIGWWTFDLTEMRRSRADLWILVIYHAREGIRYIVIPPRRLAQLLSRIHRGRKKVHSYFMVTRRLKCWEVRGLPKADWDYLANGGRKAAARDFTHYLDNWAELKRLLRTRKH